MDFETQIDDLNQHYFFREFTYTKNTFRPEPQSELELADKIVWLDDLVIAYQLKERNPPNRPTAETEEKWFQKKVLGEATRQIRDTHSFLQSQPSIELRNRRGHSFHLQASKVREFHSVICYAAHKALPRSALAVKFHRSRTVGFIHVLPASDYRGLLRTLLTPAEVAEYLNFRRKIVTDWEKDVAELPEQALVGQFLSGLMEEAPNFRFVRYLNELEHHADEWDMSGIIDKFHHRLLGDSGGTDYYRILAEIAKLKRTELKEFKLRYRLSMEKARENVSVYPYRMFSPRTNCGFVFIPVCDKFRAKRRQELEALTELCKYDLKMDKCIGVTIGAEEDGWYSIEWAYVEYPWECDLSIEKVMADVSPFRPVSKKDLGRYQFRGKSS